MGEKNILKWFGIRPTDPEEDIPVKQGTAANLKVEAAIAAGQSITVVQGTAASLKAQIEIAAAQRVAVTQATPANLKATVIGDDALPLKVKQDTAANLKCEVTPKTKVWFDEIWKKPTGVTWVRVSDTANNATEVVYTVPGDKQMFFFHYSFTANQDGTAAGLARMFITNAADTFKYDLFRTNLKMAQHVFTTLNMSPPLEIPTGWKIKIEAAANITIYVFLCGMVE